MSLSGPKPSNRPPTGDRPAATAAPLAPRRGPTHCRPCCDPRTAAAENRVDHGPPPLTAPHTVSDIRHYQWPAAPKRAILAVWGLRGRGRLGPETLSAAMPSAWRPACACVRAEESSSSAHPALARRHWLAPFSTRHRRRRPGPIPAARPPHPDPPEPIDVQWLAGAPTGPNSAAIPFGAFGPLVPEVGGYPTPTPGAHPVDLPTAAIFDLLQLVRRAVLSRARGKHLVLVVDDAHRLDEASATLIFQLVSSGDAAALIAVRSAAPMPDGVRALWKEGLVGRIDLQPLNREHTAQLARHLLAGQVDGDLAGALWDLSRGNPLYLRELLLAGKDAGRIVLERGLWRLRGKLAVGPRLTELVHERLGRVSRSEMTTLEMVAFADSVPLSVLTRLTPGSSISSLQRQGLITAEAANGADLVRPGHPVYGAAIRAGLPAPRAHDLRIDLATAFEAAGRLGADLLRGRDLAARCRDRRGPRTHLGRQPPGSRSPGLGARRPVGGGSRGRQGTQRRPDARRRPQPPGSPRGGLGCIGRLAGQRR